MLKDVLSNSEVDGLVFGWQDAAERAQLVLAYPPYSHRGLNIGAYLSRDVEAAKQRFDVSLDLEPHQFGAETVDLLIDALSSKSDVLKVVSFNPTLSRPTGVGDSEGAATAAGGRASASSLASESAGRSH